MYGPRGGAAAPTTEPAFPSGLSGHRRVFAVFGASFVVARWRHWLLQRKHDDPASMADRSRAVWSGVVSCWCRGRLVRGEVLVFIARRRWRDACCRSAWWLSYSSYCAGRCQWSVIGGALVSSFALLVGAGQRPALLLVGPSQHQRPPTARSTSRIGAITGAGTTVPNTVARSGGSVGHFRRADPGQFSQASKRSNISSNCS